MQPGMLGVDDLKRPRTTSGLGTRSTTPTHQLLFPRDYLQKRPSRTLSPLGGGLSGRKAGGGGGGEGELPIEKRAHSALDVYSSGEGGGPGGPPVVIRRDIATPEPRSRLTAEDAEGWRTLPQGAGKGSAAGGKTHLEEALKLVTTIMGRMEKEGQGISPAEQALIKNITQLEQKLVSNKRKTRVSPLSQLSIEVVGSFNSGPKGGGEAGGKSPNSLPGAEAIRAGGGASNILSPPSLQLESSGSGEHQADRTQTKPKEKGESKQRTTNLLQKLRGISQSSGVYKKLMESNTSLESLSDFAITSAANFKVEAVSNLLRKQLKVLNVDAEIYVIDVVNQVLFSPQSLDDDAVVTPPPFSISPKRNSLLLSSSTMGDAPVSPSQKVIARLNDTSHRLVRALDGHGFFVSGGTGYFPVRLDFDSYSLGVVEVFDPDSLTETKQKSLEAFIGIAALSLRNGRLYEKVKWQKEKAEAMLLMANQLSRDNLDEAVLVRSTIETARNLTESDRCSVFLVKGEDLQAYFDDGNTVRMPLNSGIAGHVATTGETVNIVNAYKDKRFNASIDKATGYHTKTILCMPVRYEGTIVAVAQLINKLPPKSAPDFHREFTHRDEDLFHTFSAFIGVCLRNCRVNAELTQEQAKSQMVLDVVTTLANTDIRNVDEIVDKVMHGAKHLLNADRATLFLIDKEHAELYSKIADATGGKEIRFPTGKGIAGTVAESWKAENISDAYKDNRFNQQFDKQLGYRTQSMLCEPITCRGELLAVAQLVNKIDPVDHAISSFSTLDSETFRTFALFAGISLSNAALLDFAVRAGQEAMSLSNFEVGSPSLSPLRKGLSPRASITQSILKELHEVEIPEWATDEGPLPDFSLFKLREEVEDQYTGAIVFITDLIMSTGLPQKFDCPRDILLGFVWACKKRYRVVPYHNFFHAIDSCQTIYTFLYSGKVIDYVTDVEAFVLLITALAHDLDHMGVNNSFHLKTDSPLGILSSASGNNSVLEVHHCNICIEILEDPWANVFAGLNREDKNHAYRVLIDNILATDMARHMELTTALAQISAEGEPGYQKENPEHRKLACQMVMKAADISNVTKPFQLSRLWALAVTEEFFQQGDKERERGVEVAPMFDRQRRNELAQGQLGFINFVAKKFFGTFVAHFPDCAWTAQNIEDNVRSWTALQEARRGSLKRLGLNEDGTTKGTSSETPSEVPSDSANESKSSRPGSAQKVE